MEAITPIYLSDLRPDLAEELDLPPEIQERLDRDEGGQLVIGYFCPDNMIKFE